MAKSVSNIIVGSGIVLMPVADKVTMPIPESTIQMFAYAIAVPGFWIGVLAIGWYVSRDLIEHVRYVRARH